MGRKHFSLYACMLVVITLLTGCADTTIQKQKLMEFKDIPVAKNTYYDTKNSTIRQQTDLHWTGKATFVLPYSKESVIQFYRAEMAKFGWTSIETYESTPAYFLYKKNKRFMQIFIPEKTANGTVVIFVAMDKKKFE